MGGRGRRGKEGQPRITVRAKLNLAGIIFFFVVYFVIVCRVVVVVVTVCSSIVVLLWCRLLSRQLGTGVNLNCFAIGKSGYRLVIVCECITVESGTKQWIAHCNVVGFVVS